MKMIVGLGNPGNRYAGTRHNIGFDVIDEVLRRNHHTMTDQKFQADYTIWHHQGERIVLVKPYTYMNLSGEAVFPLMSYFGIGPSQLTVIYDDLDLGLGQLRYRYTGGAGGHNGMKSMIAMLGTQNFNRVRFGIGQPPDGWKVADFVLAPFTKEERIDILPSIERVAEAMEAWAGGMDFNDVMNQYN